MSSYRFTKFNSVTLPVYNEEGDASPGDTMGTRFELPDGAAMDLYGTGIAPIRYPYVRSWAAYVLADSEAALRTAIDGLRVLRGVRGALVRARSDDAAEQTAMARCTVISTRTSPDKDGIPVQWVELTFEIYTVFSSTPHADAATAIAAPTTNVSRTNAGNRTVKNAVITVHAGDAPITALDLTITGKVQLVFSGTIAATKNLVIDCGAWTVLNDGAEAYDDFALGANHHRDAWLPLEPGVNTVIVAITGGGTGATFNLAFSDAWE